MILFLHYINEIRLLQEAQSNQVPVNALRKETHSISVKGPGPTVVRLMHGPARKSRKASISEQKFLWIPAGVTTAWAARNADGERD